MSFEWSKVLDWLQFKPRLWFAVLLFTGTLLLLPSHLIEPLGLVDFRGESRLWLALGFLAAATMLISHGAGEVWKWGRRKLRFRRNMKRRVKAMQELSPEEKEVLRSYLAHQTKTRTFGLSDGVVNDLVAKQILRRASTVGYLRSFPYNLQPWAWRYLNENPWVLE